MNINLKFFLIFAILIFLVFIFNLLRRKNLNLKYTLLWLLSAAVMIIVTLFPELVLGLSSVVGIIDGVNMVFIFEGMFVLMILLSLTSIVSRMNDRNRKLTQEVALLEKRIRELEEKEEDKLY